MQYLFSVITDSVDLATPDEEAAVDVFNDRLRAEGRWVFAGGLGGPDTAYTSAFNQYCYARRIGLAAVSSGGP